jgi:excisionase family DNA binding protein
MKNLETLLRIEALLKESNVKFKELLTLEESAYYLSLSKSALYKMTSKKEIPYYIPGGKNIYFKKADLDNWVYGKKVNSVSEVEIEVDEYLCRTNKIQE